MNATKPLITVIVPVHNAGSYLDRTLENLRALDTRVDYEFILVDDHSVDDSRLRIDGWGAVLPGEVTVLAAGQRGVAHARNQALAVATGAYVWLTDADDSWDPTIVVDMYERARTTGADVVVCNATKRSPNGVGLGLITDATIEETVPGPVAFTRLLDGRLQGHLWNKLFRRDLLGENPFPPTRAHSDLGGMLRILPAARAVATLPVSRYVYFQNPGSILNSDEYDSSDLETCLRIATEVRATLPGPSEANGPFIEFKYRNVIVPVVNEFARRSAGTRLQKQLHRASPSRRLVRWSELAVLAGRRRLRLAAQAALIKLSLRTYFAAFSLRRRTVGVTDAG
ncbi:glycosyltransferase [Microbacterium sp. VKM Ac-2923]|uniref:glycosyltransferase family 2 protein n=1 Tax=Microbacterium sp. VKM Ac-2923 TaxID=2929476 RepID=UPI001FB30AAB|nr:glycosyltransferase [Microbacterium sp. VKM Ac-2923]MCJ1706812.1 glycosyltransferase [Microbacterium sp. VKM Ac-2923]